MKEKKLLAAVTFAAVTVAALLPAGCASGDDPEASGPVPLTFSTSVEGVQTRTGELTAANLTSMGVYAYFTQGNFTGTATVPNFMNDQKVTKSGSAWTYSPVKYWPENTTTDRISFFAYAPHSTEAKNASGEGITAITTATGTPRISYTVPVNEEEQFDLLAATGLLNRIRTGGALTFTMQHMLTKVECRVTSSSDIKIGDMTLKSMPTVATINFNKTTGAPTTTVVGTPKDMIPLLNYGSVAVSANVETSIATFYVLPVGNSLPTVEFSYNERDGSWTDFTITLPATPLWTAGQHIIYTFKVDGGAGVNVTTGIGTDWPATDTNVGEEDVPDV